MKYCISDIYGDYNKFTEMLKKIRLSSKDDLYVLGNIIGGSDDMTLLLDMMMRENVFPICGRNEYAALPCLKWFAEHPNDEDLADMDDEIRQKMMELVSLGCKNTMTQFRALTEEQREMVIDYLDDLTCSYEVSVKNDKSSREFLLVHAGVRSFVPDIDELLSYDVEEFISEPLDFSHVYFKGVAAETGFDEVYIVAGNTPARRIYEEISPLGEPTPEGMPSRFDKIYIGNGNIALNCGVNIGGRLGALRLDDFREFYVG